MQSIKKNYIYNLSYNILMILLPLVTTPYVSRVLGAEKLGVNSYLGSIEEYFLVFAALGTAFYGKREVARFRDDKELLSSTFWEIEILSMITTSICLVSWIIFSLFQNKFQVLYFILSLKIVAVLFDISWLYAGLERFDKLLLKNLLIKILSLILLFTCVKKPDDLWLYIMINSGGLLLGNVSLWINLKEYVDRPMIEFKKIWIHFKSTLIYFLPTIATTIYTVLDKTMLQVITTDFYQNGYYEQAVKLCRIPMMALLSMDTVMGARMAYLVEKRKNDEIHERLVKSIKLVFFLGLPMVLGLDLIIEKLIPWFFGVGFESVSKLVYIYSILILCIGINNCLSEQYLPPIGKRQQTAIIVIISAFLNFFFNLMLIPGFKAIGASVASVISEAFIAFSYIIMCRSIINMNEYIKYSYKSIIAAVFMLVVTNCITKHLHASIICTLLQIGIGALIYFAVLILLKDSFAKEMMDIYLLNRRDKKSGNNSGKNIV